MCIYWYWCFLSHTPCFIITLCFEFVKLFSFLTCFDGMKLFLCFRDYVGFDDVLNLYHVWISHGRIVDDLVYWTIFLFKGFISIFQIELYRIFDRYSGVRISWILCCHTGLGICFSNGFWYWCMSYEFLRGVLKNRGPLKDKQRLPHVRLPGRDVTTGPILSKI